MSALSIALVCSISYEFRAFLCYLEEHLVDMNGEVLAHLLIADFARHVENLPEEPDWANAFYDKLEFAFENDGDDVKNLISVSFIEHLPIEKEGISHWTTDLLGGVLRLEYDRIFGVVRQT